MITAKNFKPDTPLINKKKRDRFSRPLFYVGTRDQAPESPEVS